MRISSLHLRHHHKAITSTHQSLHFSSLPSFLLESQYPSLDPPRIQTLQTQKARISQSLTTRPFTQPQDNPCPKFLHRAFDKMFSLPIFFSTCIRSGSIVYARKLFDTMPERSLVTCSFMVSMYTKHGKSEEALKVFSDFHTSCDGSMPCLVLFGLVRNPEGMIKTGFDKEVFAGTSLIDFYVKMGIYKIRVL
ncbi:hypothetical protein ACLB2K_007550 [Fragaria x ananassa]